jgi:class 3 adenylate cyclase
MVASGVPVANRRHAANAAAFGRAIIKCMDDLLQTDGDTAKAGLRIRVGMHSGPLTAGIIGLNKWCFDVWGDTVNVASRMER